MLTATVSRENKPSPRRPMLMSLGLLVAWLFGLRLLEEGWTSVRLVRDPLSIDQLAWPEPVRDAFLQGVAQTLHVALPVAVAQVVLGLGMVVLAGASLFGGRLPLRFFLQLLGVSGLVTVAGYWLGEPVRRAMISALMQMPELVEAGPLDDRTRQSMFIWGFRIGLGLQLMALGFSMFAVSRRAAREFLAAISPPTES